MFPANPGIGSFAMHPHSAYFPGSPFPGVPHGGMMLPPFNPLFSGPLFMPSP